MTKECVRGWSPSPIYCNRFPEPPLPHRKFLRTSLIIYYIIHLFTYKYYIIPHNIIRYIIFLRNTTFSPASISQFQCKITVHTTELKCNFPFIHIYYINNCYYYLWTPYNSYFIIISKILINNNISFRLRFIFFVLFFCFS